MWWRFDSGANAINRLRRRFAFPHITGFRSCNPKSSRPSIDAPRPDSGDGSPLEVPSQHFLQAVAGQAGAIVGKVIVIPIHRIATIEHPNRDRKRGHCSTFDGLGGRIRMGSCLVLCVLRTKIYGVALTR